MDLSSVNVKASVSSGGTFSIAFLTLLEVLEKKAILEWCMNKELIIKRA